MKILNCVLVRNIYKYTQCIFIIRNKHSLRKKIRFSNQFFLYKGNYEKGLHYQKKKRSVLTTNRFEVATFETHVYTSQINTHKGTFFFVSSLAMCEMRTTLYIHTCTYTYVCLWIARRTCEYVDFFRTNFLNTRLKITFLKNNKNRNKT